MNINGIKRAKDLPFSVPETLARTIDELVEAMERDDINLDCYQDEVEGTARMVCKENDRWIYEYYLLGGWREDVKDSD